MMQLWQTPHKYFDSKARTFDRPGAVSFPIPALSSKAAKAVPSARDDTNCLRHTRYAFDRDIFNAKTLTYSKASRHPFPSGKTGKHSDSGFDRSGASLPRLVFHRSGGNVPGKAWRPWYEA